MLEKMSQSMKKWVIIAWYEPVSNAFSKKISSYGLVLLAYAESLCSDEAKTKNHTK